jgi:hypothetical protein
MFLKGSMCTLIAQTITSTSDHHHTLLMQSTMKILIILGLLLCYVYPSSALYRRDVTVDAFCSNLTAIETDLTKICRTTCLIRVRQLNTQSSGLSLRTPSLLTKSTHFLHRYTSPFTMLPSVLFYKEGLYIFMQHSSKH